MFGELGRSYQSVGTALHLPLLQPAGRSAARLARLLREQEVPGSNPGAPMESSGQLSWELVIRPFQLEYSLPRFRAVPCSHASASHLRDAASRREEGLPMIARRTVRSWRQLRRIALLVLLAS